MKTQEKHMDSTPQAPLARMAIWKKEKEKLMLYSSFLNEQYTQATYIMYQHGTLVATTTFCNTGQMGFEQKHK